MSEVSRTAERPAAASPAEDALSASFRLHAGWLHRRLTLIVGDSEEARDLVSQAFARSAERFPGGDPTSLGRWLGVVGARLAVDEVRRRRRWRLRPIEERDATWALDVDAGLWRALADIDARARAALVLTVLDGYTQAEVAAAFGMPRGTVASWLSRAKERLRPVLEVRDVTR
jgi:RNA polymerase sigma-70 factor (ECF subfamily)